MTNTPPLSDLIERLEKATGPDRELDAKIHCSCIPHPQGFPLKSSGYGLIAVEIDGELFGSFTNARSYTSSIDAAMTLVPRPMCWNGESNEDDQPWACITDGDGKDYAATGATPIIALCIAALKARLATEVEG